MSQYHLHCDECGFDNPDFVQSIKIPLPLYCPSCKLKTLYCVIYPPHIHFVDYSTVGKLAEKNEKLLGKEQISLKMEEQQEREEKALPSGMTRMKKPKNDPLKEKFGKCLTKEDKEIKKMTKERQQNYIMTGE